MEETGAVLLTQTRLLKHSGQLLNVIDNMKTAGRWQNPWYQAHRAHLHNHLKQVATQATGPGQPVNVHTSSKVASVDPHTSTATLQDGTQVHGDVIIGADGVHSVARAAITDREIRPFRSGRNAMRFMITREAALADTLTHDLATTMGSMDMWYGPDRKIVLYPTYNNTLFNLVCIHPAELSETTDDYNKGASKKQLLDVYYDFEPRVVRLLEIGDPDTIKVYPLYDMETLPTYVNDRLALIGDAAHPFTPHLAQGGAMAIEDAASLGVMLPKGTTPDQVPERLQVYNKARYERATTVQNNSRMTGGDGVKKEASTAEFKRELPLRSLTASKADKSITVHEVMDHGLSHDEIHQSTHISREYQWQRNPRAYWRQPTVFGPMPGPRQDSKGLPYSQSSFPSSSVTATIKFKTSATLLRTLFPNSSYRFTNLDTVALASFSVQTLKNLPWLAGGSYDLLGFYFHDVQYTTRSGETLHGSYCPVMFENLTDPILSGREELGLPKVFSDISITAGGDEGSSNEARISWRGAEWAKFVWKGLEEHSQTATSAADGTNGNVDGDQPSHSDTDSQGLFVHKCVPVSDMADREKRRADAEYDVFLPSFFGTVGGSKTTKIHKAANAEFKIEDLGFKKLPTLHHVVERLAELPVIEVVEATIIEAEGLGDLSGARRLE